MILYCIRHGESTYNVEGRLQGQSDEPLLSPLGQRHAAALAAALAETPIEAIYASPLARAMETAEPLAAALKLPIRTDDRLKEINIGVFQGLLASEIGDVHPEATARWRSGDPDYRIPGGETRRELMQRAAAAMQAIRETGFRQVAVVAHGGVLAAALKALLQAPAERNPFMLYNGSISRIEWESQVKLMTLNQTDHLRSADCELATRTGDLA
ncbi:MAG TPA: histidine phosphatase family protein [Pirellulales bacterium]|nr:histidine phosphatase family protein [Pirellulales bacterium]